MNIVITGGAGFLGARLARTLQKTGTLQLAGDPAQPISRITLVDRVAPPPDLAGDSRIASVVGDLNDLLVPDAQGHVAAVPRDTQVVFHLAAAVSGECEADFDLGMRSNYAATHQLLQTCRALGTRPVFVFASSLAVFGQSPLLPMPDLITDTTLPTPQSSYGIQKFIGEQLVADYSRKGFIRGRSTRLMTVSVRPGRPNGAASGFLSGMIREPLAGVRAVVPVPPDTPVALASPAHAIEGLLRAAEAPDADWGAFTAINLPALTTTPRQMAQALAAVAGEGATNLLDWQVDPAIAKVVTSWPARIASPRASALGLSADADFESIVRDYVGENPEGVKLPSRA
ncbi:D-erythronate dehydrogenase [Variovorax sp. VNK109]|uniref:D-erythronate dehydrogenase n=1 Tax=Variovorax sp. VNK109 TaxID=3400919 RepID=UPI003C0E6F9F